MENIAFRLGQLAGLIGTALVALLVVGLLVTAVRAAWWLTTDHPFVALGVVLVAVLVGGRKL